MQILVDSTWDQHIADMISWLKPRALTAHTSRGQTLIIKPRRERKKRTVR